MELETSNQLWIVTAPGILFWLKASPKASLTGNIWVIATKFLLLAML